MKSGGVLRTPAGIALFLQGIALLFLMVLMKLQASIAYFQIDWLWLVLMQGFIAACLTWWRKLDSWWIVIQFLFPLSLWGAAQLQLPPSLFLVAFLFSLVLYWGTFRTQVPYFPSRTEVWREVLKLLPPTTVGRELKVVDIGSGLGGFLFFLAKHRSDCQLIGVELAPLPWLISWFRSKFPATLRRAKVQCRLMDYDKLDLQGFDVVFAYLAPPAMLPLWRKAKAEMRSGSLLLSYEFVIPGQPPDFEILIKSRQVKLYGWRF